MRKLFFALAIALSVQTLWAVNYLNTYVAYLWPVSASLTVNTSGSHDTLTHSFTWPQPGPIGVAGSIVQHINPVLFSTPRAWAYDEAMKDRWYFEADTSSLDFEMAYVAYFDTLIQQGTFGYVLGVVFKYWDEPVAYFQETRYFGFPSFYGVETFMISDTVDIFQNYASYDTVVSALKYTTPGIKVSPTGAIAISMYGPNTPSRSLYLGSQGTLPAIGTKSARFDVLGRRTVSFSPVPGVYIDLRERPK